MYSVTRAYTKLRTNTNCIILCDCYFLIVASNILETIKNATVIYVVFLFDCISARIIYVSMVYLLLENDYVNIGLSCALLFKIVLKNGKSLNLSFQHSKLRKPTKCCYQRSDFVYSNKKTERSNKNPLAGKTIELLKSSVFANFLLNF